MPGFGDYVDDGAHNGMLHHVLVLGPRATNSLLVGVNRVTRLVLPQNYTTDVNRLWGVDYLPSRPIDFGFPAINVAGLSTVGDVTAIPIQRALTTYQLSDSFSVVRGAHTINLGGEVRNTRQNGILDQLVRGSISFSGRCREVESVICFWGCPALDFSRKRIIPRRSAPPRSTSGFRTTGKYTENSA